jgi:hypothetical protein
MLNAVVAGAGSGLPHELTGLDPHEPADRERLGLAPKACDVADAS